MSNYTAPTRHPVTGAIEMADWLDDHDGKHRYGVRFPSDGKIYGSRECFECTWPDLLAEIERLRAALLFYADESSDGYNINITNYGLSTEEGAIIVDAGNIARAALAGKKTNDDATLGDQTWGRER